MKEAVIELITELTKIVEDLKELAKELTEVVFQNKEDKDGKNNES